LFLNERRKKKADRRSLELAEEKICVEKKKQQQGEKISITGGRPQAFLLISGRGLAPYGESLEDPFLMKDVELISIHLT